MTPKESILTLFSDAVFDYAPKGFFTSFGADPLYESGEVPQHHANYYRLYYALAAYYQPRMIMEIGVRLGYGIGALSLGCDKPPLYAEGWDNESYVKDSLAKARYNIDHLAMQPKRLVLRKLNSQEQSTLPAKFDMVNIDGDHSYAGAKHDIAIVAPNCKVMIVDDYHPKNHPGVFQATNEFVAAYPDMIKTWFTFMAEDFPGQSIKGTAVFEMGRVWAFNE